MKGKGERIMLKRNELPILEFDENKDAKINPEMWVDKKFDCNKMIITFFPEVMDKLIADEFTVESRMMLKGKVYRGKEIIYEDRALNDIVISRSGSLKIVKLKVYVNGQFLCEYSADGEIVTTPTGSTGYSLSAGGPIVEPNAQLLMLTPICSHTLGARSIIPSAEDIIEIEIPKRKDGRRQEVEANFDGASKVTIQAGDWIRIEKFEKSTKFIRINKISFLEVLHRKLSDQ
jgi:NAD+ kinase